MRICKILDKLDFKNIERCAKRKSVLLDERPHKRMERIQFKMHSNNFFY